MKTYKNFIAAFAAVLMLLSLFSSAVFAAEFPKHENYIADEANILTEDTISEIRNMNKNLAGDYQHTIAVCTVNTIGDEDIAVYARSLFEKWKLGEGILVLIAKEDNCYYFVPSTGVEDILTNEELAAIRDSHFEEDFSNGIYDRAVRKVTLKLKSTLVAGLQEREAAKAAEEAAAAETDETTEENKGTTVGSILVGFFKALGWLVIIAGVLFVGVFVWAMFNDDVAAILQKLIFRRNSGTRGRIPPQTYDDRLYGNPRQRPSAAQRRPNAGGYQTPQTGFLPDGRNYGGQGYPNPQNGSYNAPSMNPNYGRGGYPAQGQPRPQGYPNPQGYPQQNGGYYSNAQPQGYPQQNNYGSQPMNPNYGGQGYYPQNNSYGSTPQGYPQQNRQNPYGGQGYPAQNPGNRTGYGVPQQNSSDATVQFNIPRRS